MDGPFIPSSPPLECRPDAPGFFPGQRCRFVEKMIGDLATQRVNRPTSRFLEDPLRTPYHGVQTGPTTTWLASASWALEPPFPAGCPMPDLIRAFADLSTVGADNSVSCRLDRAEVVRTIQRFHEARGNCFNFRGFPIECRHQNVVIALLCRSPTRSQVWYAAISDVRAFLSIALALASPTYR